MENTRDLFRHNLQKFRKLKGLSQESLAEAVGLSKQQVYRIERGSSWPPPETIERLAKALGISEIRFFDSREEKFIPPKPAELGPETIAAIQEAVRETLDSNKDPELLNIEATAHFARMLALSTKSYGRAAMLMALKDGDSSPDEISSLQREIQEIEEELAIESAKSEIKQEAARTLWEEKQAPRNKLLAEAITILSSMDESELGAVIGPLRAALASRSSKNSAV